jgi:hypothetical protein
MPAYLIPYIPERVYYLHVQGIFSDAELSIVDAEIFALMEQSTVPLVHFVVNQQQLSQLPSIQSQSKLKIGRHPKLGWVLVIGDNKLMQFLSTVVAGIFKARLRYFATFAEAVAFLQHVDTTLPDLNAHEYRQNIADYIPLDVRS